jgi:hypothetical protein
MNRNDAICVLTAIDRFRPGYAEWRSEQAHKLAGMHGTKASDESRAIIDSVARTLADVTTEEAAAVVEALETGSMSIPFWGEMATAIRGQAIDDRRGRRDAERYQRESDRRLHCLDCEDRGNLTVYNPAFIAWIRPRFEECARTGDFPKGWYREAVLNWNRKVVKVLTDKGRGLDAAPAEVPLVCRCNCPDAEIFRRQLARMADSLRDAKAKPFRAAYIGQWTQGKQCVMTFDPHADLTAWFAEHDADEAYQWDPHPNEYAAHFQD